MLSASEHLLSRDGLQLFYRFWVPKKCEKILCIIHGLGEHSGRYEHVATFLTQHKIGVFALDLRGHGKSKGKRGHANKIELLINDIEELLKKARSEYLDLPMYLFGHSMGGNLVANFLLQDDSKEVAGFILSSPWLLLQDQPPKWKRIFGDIMARYAPAFTIANDINADHISKDKREVKKYQNDPLIHDRISAGLFNAISSGARDVLNNSKEISTPGLIYHGTKDKLVSLTASREFAQSNPLFEWHEIKNAFHEPHNDQERDEVLKLILDWLNKH